jgi:hypothetical protein
MALSSLVLEKPAKESIIRKLCQFDAVLAMLQIAAKAPSPTKAGGRRKEKIVGWRS